VRQIAHSIQDCTLILAWFDWRELLRWSQGVSGEYHVDSIGEGDAIVSANLPQLDVRESIAVLLSDRTLHLRRESNEVREIPWMLDGTAESVHPVLQPCIACLTVGTLWQWCRTVSHEYLTAISPPLDRTLHLAD
jgi:hypothetical protein